MVADTQPILIPRRNAEAGRRKHRRQFCRETARHRVLVTVLVASAIAMFYAVQLYLWPHNPLPRGLAQEAWSWSGLIWAVAFVPAVFELTGLYLWRAPAAPARRIGNLVSWRIVSKGLNTEALTATIEACRQEMRRMPLFPYVIEVLVDRNTAAEGLPPEGGDMHYLRVPHDYTTPNGTAAKARALHYALQTSPLGHRCWIVHMDEESQPTRSGIIGIAAMIR